MTSPKFLLTIGFLEMMRTVLSLSPTDRAMCRLLRGFQNIPTNVQGWSCIADIPNNPVCTWTGVVCSNDVITELIIGDTFPFTTSSSLSSYIGVLTSLQIVQVNGNYLQGTIPSEIGHLSALQNLQLQQNRFSGTVPSSLCNLNLLQILLLNSNPNITCSPLCLFEAPSRQVSFPNLTSFSVDSTVALCTGPTVSPTWSPTMPTNPPTQNPTPPANSSGPILLSSLTATNASLANNVLVPIIVAAIACALICCCIFIIHRSHVKEVEEEVVRKRRVSIQEENKARRRSSLISKSQVVADF